MPSHSVNHDINFDVEGNSHYYLTVVIGNGQVGSTSFQNINGDFFSPDVENTFIGQGSQIKNKSLNVVSVVMEVNPMDDDMIVSYFISTNPNIDPQTDSPTDEVPYPSSSNETVTFFTKLNFR